MKSVERQICLVLDEEPDGVPHSTAGHVACVAQEYRAVPLHSVHLTNLQFILGYWQFPAPDHLPDFLHSQTKVGGLKARVFEGLEQLVVINALVEVVARNFVRVRAQLCTADKDSLGSNPRHLGLLLTAHYGSPLTSWGVDSCNFYILRCDGFEMQFHRAAAEMISLCSCM